MRRRDKVARFCVQCGNALENGSRFCPVCGRPVAAMPVSADGPSASPRASMAPSPVGTRNRRMPIIVIAIVCAIAFVLGGLGGGLWWSHHNHDVQLAACRDAVGRIREAEKNASDQMARARRLTQITDEQVDDAGTIDAFNDALNDIPATISSGSYSCPADGSAADLKAMAQRASDDLSVQNKRLDALEKASDAVESSRDSKSFDTNKTALRDKIDAAQSLLDSSDGNVDDDANRQTLSSSIDSANALLGAAKAEDSEKLAQASSDLDDAMAAVNGDVQAYREADQARCSAWAGTYAIFQAGGTLTLNADCSYSEAGSGPMPDAFIGSFQYQAHSFVANDDGSYSWRNTDGDTVSYYPSGVHDPVSDEYFAHDGSANTVVQYPRVSVDMLFFRSTW